MSKVEIHHFTGETPIEKQHTHEMETLKVLHRLAGDEKRDELFELLGTIENEDKRKDFARMFAMGLSTISSSLYVCGYYQVSFQVALMKTKDDPQIDSF